MMIALAALMAMVGVALLAAGFRGVLQPDRSFCRRCDTDLDGDQQRRVDPKGGGIPGGRCRQCGGDLERFTAVRAGRRRRRPRMIAAGVAAVIVAGGAVALDQARSRGLDLSRYEPVWVLVRRGGAAPGDPGADQARAELLRRLRAGRLDTATIEKVVAVALEHQGDRSAAWSPQWGAFVEGAWHDGQIDAVTFHRYIRAAVVPFLEVRAAPTVPSNGVLPVTARLTEVRGGERSTLGVMITIDDVTISGRIDACPWQSIEAAVVPLDALGDPRVRSIAGRCVIDAPPGGVEVSIAPRVALVGTPGSVFTGWIGDGVSLGWKGTRPESVLWMRSSWMHLTTVVRGVEVLAPAEARDGAVAPPR